MLKRIRSRREQQEKVKSENRLPPGQSLTQKFPVLHYGPIPQTALAEWDFRIFGEVEAEVRWNWEEFSQLPQTEVTLDLHCVTRWSKFDTTWSGVSIKTLVDKGFIKLKPTVQFVVQHCENNYTTNTPLDLALQDNFLLATHYEGEPIPLEHGWPLRAVVGSFADRSEEKKRLPMERGANGCVPSNFAVPINWVSGKMPATTMKPTLGRNNALNKRDGYKTTLRNKPV